MSSEAELKMLPEAELEMSPEAELAMSQALLAISQAELAISQAEFAMSQAELARQAYLLSEALNRRAAEGSNQLAIMRAAFAKKQAALLEAKKQAARLEAEKALALARLQLAALEQLRENNYEGTGSGRQFP